MVLDAAALTGRTVLVTGASGGIGAATAAVVGAAGAGVIAHYGSRRAAAESAVADVPDDRAWVLQGDLRTPTGARELWVAANRLATVDVVVLNAAVDHADRRSRVPTTTGMPAGRTCSQST